MPSVLVLGCGYAGERVAQRLLDRGDAVHVTARRVDALRALEGRGAAVHALDGDGEDFDHQLEAIARALPDEVRMLYSIPPAPRPASGRDVIHDVLRALSRRLARVVYVSTTSVYGEGALVDELTAPAPRDDAARLRLEAERVAAAGPWSALVLRPAAIYGPRRGVHVLLRDGAPGRVSDPDRLVSRVHVDDLAALAVAAIHSELTGCHPVADDEPATTRQVAAWCEALGLPPMAGAGSRRSGGAPSGRRVDGRAIREALGVKLSHPSYRTGIPSALAEERAAQSARA